MKISTVTAAALIFLSILATAQPKPVITVLDFKTSGVSEREMKSIISLLSNSLFKTGKFTVIDVAQREALLKEIEFSISDCVEEKCQIEIGKQLSAELIVVGSIDKVGSGLVLSSKVMETQSARIVSVADGAYHDLDELVKNVGKLASELAGLPAARPSAPAGFVLVEAGSFRMGSGGGDADEKPIHRVTISRSFYVSQHEVTQKKWREVIGTDPSKFKGDDLPVENLTWYDAMDYCNRLSQLEGLTPCYSGSGDAVTCDFSADGYRLPTEAEWEYAARGGKRSRVATYAGSDRAEEVGWHIANSGSITHLVGQKAPNELMIYDMSGNVWEWCWDWYSNYSASSVIDPRGAEAGPGRVYRGGSWNDDAGSQRLASRAGNTPEYASHILGFRPVRTAE